MPRPMLERAFRILRPVAAKFWLVTRGMTLGVRGVVLDGEDRVLLIRHGYTPGWHFPGGGVEVGETLLTSLSRELDEEAAIAIHGAPVLHGVFRQKAFSRRDHVAVFIVRDFSWGGPKPPNREIAGCAFYALDALPEDTSPGTRRRLAEIIDGAAISQDW